MTQRGEGEPDPLKLMDATGHSDLATTLQYRHARPVQQRATLEKLSRRLPIAKIVTRKAERAVRKNSGSENMP